MAVSVMTREVLSKLAEVDLDQSLDHERQPTDTSMAEIEDTYSADSQLLEGVAATLQDKKLVQDQIRHNASSAASSDATAGSLRKRSNIHESSNEGNGVLEDSGFCGIDDDVNGDLASDDDDGEQRDDGAAANDSEGVGAVKIKPRHLRQESEETPSLQDAASEAGSIHAASDDSDADSEVEADWAAAAAIDEREDPPNTNPNRCVYCQQDEDEDPSEDFEEYLACAVCGDGAHQQCARDAAGSPQDTDVLRWRCPDCVGNDLHSDAFTLGVTGATAALLHRRASAPKIARDLLPPQRGMKSGAHTVFAKLVHEDDPLDGSRLLRNNKRKLSSVEAEESLPARKRRPTSSHGSLTSVSPAILTSTDADEVMNVDITSFQPKPARTLRIKLQSHTRPRSSVIKKTRVSLVVNLQVNSQALEAILTTPPRPIQIKKKTSRSSRGPTAALEHRPTPHQSAHHFYALHDKESDEMKTKPYGGILTEEEANTERCLPDVNDRRQFDEAKQKAEEEWEEKYRAHLAAAELAKKDNSKRKKVSGPASQIECINFGNFEIDTWYAAPYPEEYSRNRVLYICEFCLKYMSSDYVAWRHKTKCHAKHPPGDEIYRERSVSMFEVDGRKNPVYCQNLCLLAKLFLGSKTLYYDVEPFLFYIMTETDQFGCHFVGYFSKEKRPSSQNNVSCIMTLPIHQRKGYGNLLIDFSYLLTRVEGKNGSPEKPLSDMGLVSYRNYWRLVLCYLLRAQGGNALTITEMCGKTGMTADDVISALEGLRALVKDPMTRTYALRLDLPYMEEYIQKWEAKGYVKLNENSLNWYPFMMGRQHAGMVEHIPVSTVAPREEDETIAPDATEESATLALSQEDGVALQGDGIATLDHTIEKESPCEAAPAPWVLETGTAKAEDHDGSPSSTSPRRPSGSQEPVIVEPHLTNGYHEPDQAATSNKDPRFSDSTDFMEMSTPTSFGIIKAMQPPELPIPPTRFEIFPPPGKSRANRPTTSTPGTVPRTAAANAARKRRARQNGYLNPRRSAASTARANAARRRTGGTGRGPGRWPKGSRKSDFGGADSGRGIVPGSAHSGAGKHSLVNVSEDDDRAGNDVFMQDENDDEDDYSHGNRAAEGPDEDDEDAILYETPRPKRRSAGTGARQKSTTRRPASRRTNIEVVDVEADDDEEFLVTGDLEVDDDEDE